MKKQKNLKVILALTLVTACSASSAFAQYAGIFGYGLELRGVGAGAANPSGHDLHFSSSQSII